MSGMQEITKEHLDAINRILQGKPDYFRGFINFMTDLSIRTKYRYLNHIVAFMQYVNKEPSELTIDDFNSYLNFITYKKDGSKTTSSHQINIYSSLKKFNEYLYVSNRLKENYMLFVKRPKAKESQNTILKRENGYLTETELKEYIDNLEWGVLSPTGRMQSVEWDARDKAIILTFLYTGIRESALRMIDIEDVDLQDNQLIVTDKGEKVKIYDIPDKLCEAIQKWLDYREKLMEKFDDKALFITKYRKRMGVQAIIEVVKKYADTLDKHITPHKLRATYGTHLYNKTGDIYFVQQCMGHSSPKTTELYIRDKKKNTKRASDIMGELL